MFRVVDMKIEDFKSKFLKFCDRSKKAEQKAKSKTGKKLDTRAKYDKLFGPTLFGVIFLFVFGGVLLAYIPCKSGYRIVE